MTNMVRRERSKRLQDARLRAGLSQPHVAEQMKCSRQLVGSWERGGNISAEQLAALCVLYGCTSDEILFDRPESVLAEDGVAQQFMELKPGLRERLWMFYQVFIRRGAADLARAPGNHPV